MPVNWEAVGFTLFPNIGGIANEFILRNNDTKRWFESIKKPSWVPSHTLPIWPAIYSGMGYSSYLVYRDGGGFQGDAKLPLALYASQLALNFAWAPIFFGCRSLKWGAAEKVLLAGNAAITAVAFHKINPTASYIMILYVVALSLSSLMTIKLYLLNKDEEPEEPKKK